MGALDLRIKTSGGVHSAACVVCLLSSWFHTCMILMSDVCYSRIRQWSDFDNGRISIGSANEVPCHDCGLSWAQLAEYVRFRELSLRCVCGVSDRFAFGTEKTKRSYIGVMLRDKNTDLNLGRQEHHARHSTASPVDLSRRFESHTVLSNLHTQLDSLIRVPYRVVILKL